MLPPEQATGGLLPPGSHSGFGDRELSNVITAPAACGTMPTKPADWYHSVVPVFAAIGLVQPSDLAEVDAVPMTASWLRPVSSVLANPSGSARSQGSSVTGTGLPFASVTESIGLGGHHMPPLSSVAPTLASSRMLVGVTPRVNEARCCALVTSAMERLVRLPVAGSTNGVVASERSPILTAMSTTAGTPVNSSSFTNAVFGESASASHIGIEPA